MTVNSITKFRNWLPLHFALRQKCRGVCPPETGEPKGGEKDHWGVGRGNHSALKSDTILRYMLYIRVRET